MSVARQCLCRLEALDNPGSRGFVIERDGRREEIFVVRRESKVFAYRNRCPHTGAPLDWREHEYLDESGEFIQCANHAALFRLEDGYCVAGPCRRQHLEPVGIRLEDQDILLDEPGALLSTPPTDTRDP